MNSAKLIRGPSTDQGTFGRWVLPGWTCHSVELPDRGNASRISRVPDGVYLCEVVFSNHCNAVFGILWSRVYTLRNVPGRGNILIHPGCYAGDISLGWTSNFQGCIGAGEQRGALRNKTGVMQQAALSTKPAVRRIMDIFQMKPFQLEITA